MSAEAQALCGLGAGDASGHVRRDFSPLALAYLGDAVLELYVRRRLLLEGRHPPAGLHKQAVEVVSARAQHAALAALEPSLSEDEKAVVRRGRNATKGSGAKNASAREYRSATGLEALLGSLYLDGKAARLEELLVGIWERRGQAFCAGRDEAGED